MFLKCLKNAINFIVSFWPEWTYMTMNLRANNNSLFNYLII